MVPAALEAGQCHGRRSPRLGGDAEARPAPRAPSERHASVNVSPRQKVARRPRGPRRREATCRRRWTSPAAETREIRTRPERRQRPRRGLDRRLRAHRLGRLSRKPPRGRRGQRPRLHGTTTRPRPRCLALVPSVPVLPTMDHRRREPAMDPPSRAPPPRDDRPAPAPFPAASGYSGRPSHGPSRRSRPAHGPAPFDPAP